MSKSALRSLSRVQQCQIKYKGNIKTGWRPKAFLLSNFLGGWYPSHSTLLAEPAQDMGLHKQNLTAASDY